jgi:serine/threonine-protein kinase ATR
MLSGAYEHSNAGKCTFSRHLGHVREFQYPARSLLTLATRDSFERLNEKDSCLLIQLITYVGCAADNTLSGSEFDIHRPMGLRCSFCKTAGIGHRPTCFDVSMKARATSSFSKLIKLSSFLQSKRPRVVAMIGLRRLVIHSVDPELLDLETSAPGQWCLQSLQSSIRELRIAAG